MDGQQMDQESRQSEEEIKDRRGLSSAAIEFQHVMSVYDRIACHFSDTRHTPWPKVADFVKSLPPGSLLYDVGCGNGKYSQVNPEIVIMASDLSNQLLSIAKSKTGIMDVFVADVKSLPIRPSSADAFICVAVIHHLASQENRRQGLSQLVNLLKPGGCGLVTVWAFEQSATGEDSKYIQKSRIDKSDHDIPVSDTPFGLPVHKNRTPFVSEDVLVPWKDRQSGETLLRYYHVFRKGELTKLCQEVPFLEVMEEYYDEGNWCVIVRRR